MKKCAEIIVDRRRTIFAVMMLLTVIGAVMMLKVNLITDMTQYLPESSEMKRGITLMKEDFENLTMSGTIRVMTTGMDDVEVAELIGKLREIEEISVVTYRPGDANYQKDGHALVELTVLYDYKTPEMEYVKSELMSLEKEYPIVYQTGEDSLGDIPPAVLLMAVSILFAILFLMCRSWTEPFLFLLTIGCAIAINNGTNALLAGVSNITYSIAAILQLVLSMDYSIILINRYREERKQLAAAEVKAEDDCMKYTAMKQAIEAAAPSIAGSSLTTVVGLLALVFMSFTIGADIGIVLAKGVLISMICIMTILPALILHFDRLIEKTQKGVIPLPTGMLAAFSYKRRHALGILLLLLFAVTFYLKGGAPISYTLFEPNPIDDVFGQNNAIVLLYDNEDEGAINDLVDQFGKNPSVKAINSYATTLGKPYTCDEMLAYISEMGFDAELSKAKTFLPLLYSGVQDTDEEPARMTPEELFEKAEELMENPLTTGLVSAEMKEKFAAASDLLAAGKERLVGKNHSILMFATSFPPESEETTLFLEELRTYTDSNFSKKVYQIGNSPMQNETAQTFRGELNKISLITAGAIFGVVLLTFGNVFVPVLLILLIQTAVYLTMLFMGAVGSEMYYLALLIVQSILMGATIDYGILFVSLYREARLRVGIREAVAESYEKSIHTIMTSGLIIVFVTWIVGYAFTNPAITQICHIITIGSVMALILILTILPGSTALFDCLIMGKKK